MPRINNANEAIERSKIIYQIAQLNLSHKDKLHLIVGLIEKMEAKQNKRWETLREIRNLEGAPFEVKHLLLRQHIMQMRKLATEIRSLRFLV